MEAAIPWRKIEQSGRGEVVVESPTSGRMTVWVGARKQRVQIELLAAGQGSSPGERPFPIVRLTTMVVSRERALKALVLGKRRAMAERESVRLLDLLSHNDRLPSVHLHLTAQELRASADLVCLGGAVDDEVLLKRIVRLAKVADGMERRVGGQDRW